MRQFSPGQLTGGSGGEGASVEVIKSRLDDVVVVELLELVIEELEITDVDGALGSNPELKPDSAETSDVFKVEGSGCGSSRLRISELVSQLLLAAYRSWRTFSHCGQTGACAKHCGQCIQRWQPHCEDLMFR